MNIKIYNDDNLSDSEIDEVVTRVKAFIINSKNEILYANSGGGIQLIGGHVEKDETLENTVKRELLEETGIVLQSEEISLPFFEIKHYTKNYKRTGKNRISNVIYFFIKTDKKPNNNKMNLTTNEVKNKFSYNYCPINRFEDLLNSCINSDIEINAVIAKEILIAFEELKKILWKLYIWLKRVKNAEVVFHSFNRCTKKIYRVIVTSREENQRQHDYWK